MLLTTTTKTTTTATKKKSPVHYCTIDRRIITLDMGSQSAGNKIIFHINLKRTKRGAVTVQIRSMIKRTKTVKLQIFRAFFSIMNFTKEPYDLRTKLTAKC